MKTNYLYLILAVILVSCGTKAPKNIEGLIQEIESYSKKIDADKGLGSETIEGALTDAEGFKDIGNFKYTVFFNKETKELLKIVNVETTDKTTRETYYFNNNILNYFDSSTGNQNAKRLYLNNGKAVSLHNISSAEQKLFLAKARRFKKEFAQNH